MNIGFIGAGKVGFSLGKYFSENNLSISGYYDMNNSFSEEAAEFTKSTAFMNINKLIESSDIIFITTGDNIISQVWNEIKFLNIKNKIICHCSGSLSSKIFSDINNSCAFSYSIHPMFAFSDKYSSYKELKTAYFSLEGDEKHLDYLKNLFESLGNKVILIDSEIKPLYHLASVTVSNLVLSLLDIGCSYLSDCGIDSNKSLEALIPLIMNNINNIKHTNSFIDSLTGPVERNDINTVKHHLDVIPKENIPLYKILSQNLVKIAELKNTSRDYEELKKILKHWEEKANG